ncbi:hypothetical protein DEO72_LG7g1086 [Vigna unguiculata]|uniref:Uncharacterized protein n=1 Tax=Vigna unguiculata TaxID=3917 RepID=A0A4D6MGC4_VIGUN|nr:hypothetical protein DEO72_LG7g1086 [Vigna unguiculata]
MDDVHFRILCTVNANWLVGHLGAKSYVLILDLRPYKARPSGSTSLKRELQSITLGSGSWFSPRRPGQGLSDMVSRPGERHSPRREALAQARGTRLSEVARKPESFERDISPKREVLSFEQLTLSPRREWLA